MLKQDIDYKGLAEKVMLATDASRIMQDQGATPPTIGFGVERILGRDFDANEPEQYLASVKKPN
jgi:nitrate/nitrite transport system substrate-binding protein